ncbi:MAG: purine-nucleoside phosphorylase [Candidatus Kerfeldbacteria bacterium]|nr:purine-nucleoside phosphorylase [Candidatus Kerfeldbacteria bacterium]
MSGLGLLQRNPYAAARAAAGALEKLTDVMKHDIAIVLGSGWAPAADFLGPPDADFPVTDLPGFLPPIVDGHAGRVRSVTVGERHLLVFLGRTHLYEGHGVEATVHAVRTAGAAGCRIVILTNGCGGLEGWHRPGMPVLIRDHLNLTGQSPLPPACFLDQTEVYSARLRALGHEVEPSLTECVYAQVRGPQYETPAEIGMIKTLGGQLVGMSTVLEAIAAREAGMEVLGLSLVTNQAAGMTGRPLSHQEVQAAGQAAAERIGRLLAEVINRL